MLCIEQRLACELEGVRDWLMAGAVCLVRSDRESCVAK